MTKKLTMTETYVNVTGSARKFWTVKADFDNKRVTLYWGRIGTKGGKKVFLFEDRPTTREFVEARVESKLRKGYVQVA